MHRITIEHNPSPAKLDAMGIDYWPIWEKGISTFDWVYDKSEKCYILEGEVIVTPIDGEPVVIKARDLVNFSKGLSCKWEVIVPVKKHYILD
jgi:hypothetical protein